jgi:hypothetical protein
MTDSDADRPDRALRALFRQATVAGVDAGPCPDEVLLAGLVENRLFPEEREEVERHLAACPRCLDIVGTLATRSAARTRPEATRMRLSMQILLAAAGLAVLTTLGLLLLGKGRDEATGITEARLLAAASDIARKAPRLFADFKPLTRDERLSPRSPVERGGGLVPLLPANTVLGRTPTFRWEAAPGVESYEVALLRAGAGTLWTKRVKGTELEYPAGERSLDPGGRYVWKVSFEGVFGREEGGRAFGVASDEERTRFESAMEAIRTDAPPDLRTLLTAHLAIRSGLLGKALENTRAFVTAKPDEIIGRETLYHVLTLLGAEEAKGLLHDEGKR